VERFDLNAVASRRVGELSGGYRRRVDLAAALVASPKVLFLDEPSTGLDPGARQDVWDVVTELTSAGTTVVLTTQYLEEADRLADHLVVLSSGRIVAEGGPRELKRLVGGKVVRATVSLDAAERLPMRPVTSSPSGATRVTATFAVSDDEAVADLIARLHAGSVDATDLEVASPSLDDVFFHLTQTGAAA